MAELRIYGADPEDLGRREQLAIDFYEDCQPALEAIASEVGLPVAELRKLREAESSD